MERERTVDFESDGRLKEWAFKLDRMKGILSLDKIVDELYDWTPRRGKTIEAFNRLPEEFTIDDVIQCFALKNNTSARSRVVRLMKDNLVVKVDEYVDNGTTKAMYKKTGLLMH